MPVALVSESRDGVALATNGSALTHNLLTGCSFFHSLRTENERNRTSFKHKSLSDSCSPTISPNGLNQTRRLSRLHPARKGLLELLHLRRHYKGAITLVRVVGEVVLVVVLGAAVVGLGQ